MKELLYYKPSAMAEGVSARFPGLTMLSYFFELYNAGAIPVDRTGIVNPPVRMRSLFPMPKLVPMKKTYEEICNDRAREILARSDMLSCDIYLLWSGGIDSTLATVSLLKNSTEEQKKRLVLLMSEDSIMENPNFFRDHVSGKLRTETRSALYLVLGSRKLLVSGEHNDQLFGSDMTAPMIEKHGNGFIHAPYNRSQILAHYEAAMGNREIATNYIDLFERLVAAAPMPLRTNFEFLWWINFCLKWQTVFARMLTFVSPHNEKNITPQYVRDYYMPFYNTTDFQLWSMNNLDKRIKDEWRTYKWPAKEVIYGYTKDADYRDNKLKVGSLSTFMRTYEAYKFLDADYKLYRSLPTEEFYNPDTNFKDPVAHDIVQNLALVN